MPGCLFSSSQPLLSDTRWFTLNRILCALNNGSGGGGGGDALTAEVWSGVGNPVHTPTVANQVYTNTTDGSEWKWYDSSWH